MFPVRIHLVINSVKNWNDGTDRQPEQPEQPEDQNTLQGPTGPIGALTSLPKHTMAPPPDQHALYCPPT